MRSAVKVSRALLVTYTFYLWAVVLLWGGVEEVRDNLKWMLDGMGRKG